MMTNYNYISKLMVLALAISFAACSNDEADTPPGVWTELESIETFSGDTVLVTGQVSNYVGMRSVTIECQAWNIKQVYELDGKHSKVFNYNYQMVVPTEATFDQELEITVSDINGKTSRKTVPISFLPDTQAPVSLTNIPSQISVDFDNAMGYGLYNVDLNLRDDRDLAEAKLSIPATNYSKTFQLSGRHFLLREQIKIESIGTFSFSLTLTDTSGNISVYKSELVAMITETENPYEDYRLMWVISADKNANDYLDGYYSPMSRVGEYQYEGKIYADKDNYRILFTTEKSMDGEILFGVSPYVSSKLMNNKGYVIPITVPQKGYYGVDINLQAHSYNLKSIDPSGAYTGPLTLSGCGFHDFGDWGTASSEMTRDTYRYTDVLNQNGSYSDTRQYYAADTNTWQYSLHWWSDDNGCGWWEDKEGWGGQNGTYVSTYDGPVEITFDTAILWATVKKTN